MYGAHNRKGKSFALMKTFWERSPKINICSVGKIKRKWSYFLTAATSKVEKCCKGQPSSFGLRVFYFILFNSKTVLFCHKSMRFCEWYIWYVYAAVAIPTVPWLKTEHPPQSPAYQTACGMFYYAVPVRRRNLQFKVFLLLMNGLSTQRPLARGLLGNLIKYTHANLLKLCLRWWPGVCCWAKQSTPLV